VKVKLSYKSAIKDAIISADKEFNEDLADHIRKKDFNSFWKSWRIGFCSQKIKPTRVLNKGTGDMNILDEFITYYTKVGQTKTNSVGADNKFKSFVTSFIQAETNINSHSNALIVEVHVVQEKMNNLKLCKAAGHDNILNEHLIIGGSSLAVHLSLLFTAMVRHAFVPESFRFGIIKPILKNKHGDQTNLDMYRGITLTPAISSRLRQSFYLYMVVT